MFDPCPWGCAPSFSTRAVQGPEPNHPDRVRAVVWCKHARMEGDRHLFLSREDWRALAKLWNHRPVASAPEPDALRSLASVMLAVLDAYVNSGDSMSQNLKRAEYAETRAKLERLVND